MKCIIQIPCYNEADTLAITLKSLPRKIDGFDAVKWLIIDDGSTDNTVDVAKKNGADYIVSHTQNFGLAKAFMTGLQACLAFGADVIVNTDADNQYNADDIPLLLKPILECRAEMVIGSRPIAQIKHFSPLKKFLQYLGSFVVRLASGTTVDDAPSGFRAITRTAAARFMVYNSYTYTLETIIQAGQQGIPVVSVPIRVNADLRPSRLVKSISSYVKRSIFTILRIFVLYRPFLFFMTIGSILFLFGFMLAARYLVYFILDSSSGHVQSLILANILLLWGSGTWIIAIVTDLLAANRRLLEDLRFAANLHNTIPPPHTWHRASDQIDITR